MRVGDVELSLTAQDIVDHLGTIIELGKTRRSSANMMICCPIHHESNPSCGISDSGAVNCFACGYKATIDQFIGDVFNQDKEWGKRWILTSFGVEGLRPDINIDTRDDINTYVNNKILDSYRYIHPYMYKRGLTNAIIEQFDVGYDRQTNCLTFPVRDKLGRTLFVAKRSVATKFFNYPENQQKPLYGLFEICAEPKLTKSLIVCESIFNCLSCWKYGKPAVALLGLGTEYQYKQLEQLPIRKLILGLDPDSKGEAAATKLFNRLQDRFIIECLDLPKGKDLNDLDLAGELNKYLGR